MGALPKGGELLAGGHWRVALNERQTSEDRPADAQKVGRSRVEYDNRVPCPGARLARGPKVSVTPEKGVMNDCSRVGINSRVDSQWLRGGATGAGARGRACGASCARAKSYTRRWPAGKSAWFSAPCLWISGSRSNRRGEPLESVRDWQEWGGRRFSAGSVKSAYRGLLYAALKPTCLESQCLMMPITRTGPSVHGADRRLV